MLRNKGMNETTETILYCLLGLLIAVSLNRGLAVALDTSLPVVTVSSGSMIPTLNVGDIAVIYGRDGYEVNDIIVFNGWENEPIIHRIVGVVKKSNGKITTKRSEKLDIGKDELKDYGEEYFRKENDNKIYITKGDNTETNRKCDQCMGASPVIESQIHGKSIFVIPYLGWVKLLIFRYVIHNPLGLVATGLLILAFIFYKIL